MFWGLFNETSTDDKAFGKAKIEGYYSLIKGMDTILIVNGTITEQIGLATFSDAFTFVLLIVILVFKPTGLFGEKTTDKV